MVSSTKRNAIIVIVISVVVAVAIIIAISLSQGSEESSRRRRETGKYLSFVRKRIAELVVKIVSGDIYVTAFPHAEMFCYLVNHKVKSCVFLT